MADLKRLEQALVAADAAGDTEAAQAIAAEIRRQSSIPITGEMSAIPQYSGLKNFAAEALGGLADLDKALPTPVPVGIALKTMMGIDGPPTQGDPFFRDTATARAVRFAAPAAVPLGAQTKIGAAGQSVFNTAIGATSGLLDSYAENKDLPGWQRSLIAMTPLIGGAGATAGFKGTLRGSPSSAREMAANIDELERAGITDFSVSQVAPEGNKRLPLMERSASFAFGGQGPFQDLGAKQSAQFNAKMENIAGGTLDDAERAGQTVWNSLFAEKKGWVSRAKAQESALWSPVDDAISKNAKATKTDALGVPIGEVSSVETPAIQKALEGIVKAYDDPAMAAALGGDKVGAAKLLEALKASGGRMSYNDFKNLRRELGELQSGSLLIPGERGISAGQASRLWAAMLDDYGALAKLYGVDKELAAARGFSKKYHDDSRNFFKTIFGKEAEPTKIIDEISAGNFQQPAKIRALREAMGPEFSTLQEYVINRLGTPAGSKTGAFSLETFHTNYNNRFAGAGRAGEAVADAMFGPKGTATRDALDTMFKIAERTKQGSQLLFNTSGTAGSGIAGASWQAVLGDLAKKGWMVTAGAGLGATFGGAPGIMVGIGGGAAINNMAARLFTSPRFSRWLSKTAFQSNARVPAALSVLAQTKLESDELEEAKLQFLAAYDQRFGGQP